MLWVRSFETPEPRTLAGTEGAMYPFWSPDSQAIGFFARRQIKTIQLMAECRSLCRAMPGTGEGTWNRRT